MSAPLVSIVIPTYNRTRWLAQAVESAIHQTYTSVEVIVVDDGSATSEARDLITTHYSRVKYLYQANQGLGAARNTGLAASAGEFLLFLDDDDWLTPEAVTDKLALFAARPELGAVHSDLYVADTVGQLHGTLFRGRPRLTGGIYPAILFRANFIPVHSLIWRRQALERAGWFPPWSGGEDWDVLVRAGERGILFGYINRPHGAYRMHAANMTRDIAKQTAAYGRAQAVIAASSRFQTLPPRLRAAVLARFAVTQFTGGYAEPGWRYLQAAQRLTPWNPTLWALGALAGLGMPAFQRVIGWAQSGRARLGLVPATLEQ